MIVCVVHTNMNDCAVHGSHSLPDPRLGLGLRSERGSRYSPGPTRRQPHQPDYSPPTDAKDGSKPRELAEESRKGRAMSGGIGEAWAELESLSSCFPSRTIVRRASARTLERFTIGRSKASQVRVQPGPRGCARPRSACCASRGGITWCSCARLRTAAYACDVHGVRVLPSADGSTHARAQLCFSDRLISQIHCCLIAEPPSDAGVEACAVRLQVKVQDFSRNGTFGEDSCVRASSFSTRFHSLTERVGGRSEW
jgi:hypothetical protein